MSQNQKYDCKDCKNNESDICADCQVTDDGIPTRFEAKDQNLDMHRLSLLVLTFAAFQQEEIKEKLEELEIQDYKEKIEKREKELRERQNKIVDNPNKCCANAYFPMNPFLLCCGEVQKFQEDCYYYEEEQDMGAHIPCCDRIPGIEGYEPKNCNKDCPHYISRSKARELIDKYVKKKN